MSFEKIELIPEVPVGLQIAATRGEVILFIGAGTSMIAGCPGWDEFSNCAIKHLADSNAKCNTPLFTCFAKNFKRCFVTEAFTWPMI